MTQDFKQWWDAWWEEDYSWEGLAKKPWHGWCVSRGGAIEIDPSSWLESDPRHAPRPAGTQPATLQDYWRKILVELGHSPPHSGLIECGETNKLFTAIHFPLSKGDESNISYATQDDILLKLINESRESEFDDFGIPVGPDRRAQCNGAVLRNFNIDRVRSQQSAKPGSQLRLSAEQSFFSGEARFSGAVFSGTASFRYSAFSGPALFSKARFGHVADFRNVTFIGDVLFDEAKFIDDALLEGAVCVGDAWFNSASFSKLVSFRSSVFYSRARFEGEGAKLNQSIPFSPPASAVHGTITSEAVEPVELAERSFKKAEFDNAFFFYQAAFDNREVHEVSSFSNARFMEHATFHGSRLQQGTSLSGVECEASLNPALNLTWRRRRRLESSIPKRVLQLLYRGVVARMGGVKDHLPFEEWVVVFDQTRRREAAKFSSLPRRTSAVETGKPQDASVLSGLNEAGLPEKVPRFESRQLYFDGLESSFRTLNNLLEENGDTQEAARFFRLELLARQEKLELSKQWGKYFLSRLYEVFSDFGNSIRRPLLWLLGLWVVMAVVYAPMATFPVRSPKLTEFGEALSFSGGRIVPFGPWAGDPSACSVGGRLLSLHPTAVELEAEDACKSGLKNTYGSGTALGVSFLATLQSAFALILIFLAGVAARRRFQIN